MENGKIRPQSHSGEYYWLGPDPTQNIRGWLYPYINVSFIYSGHGKSYHLTNNRT